MIFVKFIILLKLLKNVFSFHGWSMIHIKYHSNNYNKLFYNKIGEWLSKHGYIVNQTMIDDDKWWDNTLPKTIEDLQKLRNKNEQTKMDLLNPLSIRSNKKNIESNLRKTISEIEQTVDNIQNNNDNTMNNNNNNNNNMENDESRGYGPFGKQIFGNDHNKNELFTLTKSTGISFKDIGGYEEVKIELHWCSKLLKNIEKYKKYNIRTPKGLLLEGPPGTGKTLFAKAFATESNMSFIYVSGSDFTDKYIGESSKKVKELFLFAKKHKPAIIFIDEVDGIAKSRSSDLQSSAIESNNMLNTLLVELDGFEKLSGIFIIAATNRIECLDSAFLRPGRIDKIIHIPYPNLNARKEIINIYLNGKPYDKSTFNIHNLIEITNGFSGSQIENILNEAMIYALQNDREYFNQNDINKMIERIMIGWQPLDHDYSNEDLTRIAVHEIGHCLVSFLAMSHPCFKIAKLSTNTPSTPGYTQFPPLQNIFKYEELFERIMINFGGQFAEMCVYGDHTLNSGASSDLQESKHLATKMIEDYGMGSIKIYPPNSQLFLNKKDSDISNILLQAENIVSTIFTTDIKPLLLHAAEYLKTNGHITSIELAPMIHSHYDIVTTKIQSKPKYKHIKLRQFRYLIPKRT